MKPLLYPLFTSLAILALMGCSNQQQQESSTEKPPATSSKPTVPTPEFNADSAFHFVEKQVAFGPRVPNTMQHQLCGDYLVGKLKQFGWEVVEQPFEIQAYDGTILRGRNIIGSFHPAATKRVLLAAHWDSRHIADHDPDETQQNKPILGANDGASGVAVLLEMARTISTDSLKPSLGIDIIFFDAEDYGMPAGATNQTERQITYCLGSQYWTENLHKPNYHAFYGVLLDMIGAPNATFRKEGYSMQYAPKVVDKIWATAGSLGYSQYFLNEQADPITDDHYIVNTQSTITMIDIIHLDNRANGSPFFEHWHTQQDDLNTIDKNTLKAVGQTLLHVIYNDII